VTAIPSFTDYADGILNLRYAHVVQGRKEKWNDIAARCIVNVMNDKVPISISEAIFEVIRDRKFIPGGRILSQAGRQYHQTDNCYCLQAEDTREGWADLAYKTTMMFMSGGGVGVDYSNLRPYGTTLSRSGGISSGPIPLIQMINGIGAAARQGGERRGAIYASLRWNHPDIDKFIKMKQIDKLEHTNISVRFDKEWHNNTLEDSWFEWSKDSAFIKTLQSACQYGDPGFQFDNDGNILRNACTEIISSDDCDSCCLGSINFAKIKDIKELVDVTNLGILFLLCNTLYTDTPHDKVRYIKEQNRRIGLGIMGIGEWFLQRGLSYGDTLVKDYDGHSWHIQNDIGNWLHTWQINCDHAALHWSNKLSINKPVATRAIAPTGTISIAAGHTTPGIEPVFHTAYQRTYNGNTGLQSTTVIDPIVEKLMKQGYDVTDIDTAYTLSETVDGIQRRIAFQAFMQQYVDNAISSTVNLPQYISGVEEKIAPILLRYLPQLRGITFYPNGAYDNQPVAPIDIKYALKNKATLQEHESCKGGSCGV
jgi:ribonucleoside-diphosphate reductase alpha chain